MITTQNAKIIWALDAYADKQAQLRTASLLKALTKNQSLSIEPVCVLSPDQVRVPAKAFKDKSNEYKLEAEKRLETWLKGVKMSGLQKATLLVSNDFSRRASVEALLAHAKETHAGLIAMNTHSRKGILRFLLGSFAETLLLHSKVPLFVVNPSARPTPAFKEILFPTDLSPKSREAFQRIIELASSLKARLFIYHKVEYVIPDTYSMLTHTPTFGQYLEEDGKQREKDLQGWMDMAVKKGIKTEIIFDKKPSFVTDSIVKVAKKLQGGMIAMSSSSGTMESVVLGSISRQVIRTAPCPVWVVHN